MDYKDYFNKFDISLHISIYKDYMRMKKLNKLWLLMPLLVIAGCSVFSYTKPTYQVLPYQENMIGLQNLNTRVLVYCYNSEHYTAEQCADEFENRGFVRLTNIPRFTAEHDYLKSDTYPTRRWRKDEKAPRW